MSNELREALIAITKLDDHEDLKKANRFLIERMRMKHREAAVAFRVGEQVEFTGRYGNTEVGKVTKVNQKTVIVQTATTRWTVSGGILRKVA